MRVRNVEKPEHQTPARPYATLQFGSLARLSSSKKPLAITNSITTICRDVFRKGQLSSVDSTEAAYQAEIERHYGRNLVLIILVEAVWGLGWALFSGTTILPMLLRHLGASDMLIGLLPAAFMLGMAVAQLPGAWWTQPLRVKKTLFVIFHYPGCAAIAMAGLALLWGDGLSSRLLITIIVAANGIFGLAIGVVAPMWVNILAKLLPPHRRGVCFGLIFVAGAILGLVGAALAFVLLRAYPAPHGFAYALISGGLACAASITIFFWIHEPPDPDEPQRERFGEFLGRVWTAARGQPQFLRFVSAALLLSLSGMSVGFLAVAARERLHVADARAAEFQAALLVGQLVASLLGGWIGDRFGFRATALLVPLVGGAMAILALLGVSPACFAMAFVLVGAGFGLDFISFNNMMVELCPWREKTSFLALGGALRAPVVVVAPIVGGLLAQYTALRYYAVFTVSLGLSVLAFFALLKLIRENKAAAHEPSPMRTQSLAS